MADFMEKLWGSVFAPGPTPTLLVATNVTFAALQALLLALFIGTYSIHFAILSILCGGLWYSINWFAKELRQAQAKEEEAERLRKQSAASKERDWKTRGGVADSEADDEGEDTETEQGMRESSISVADASPEAPTQQQEQQAVGGAAQDASTRSMGETGTSISLSKPGGSQGAARQRKTQDRDRSGDVSSSTDGEWEKVEGDR